MLSSKSKTAFLVFSAWAVAFSAPSDSLIAEILAFRGYLRFDTATSEMAPQYRPYKKMIPIAKKHITKLNTEFREAYGDTGVVHLRLTIDCSKNDSCFISNRLIAPGIDIPPNVARAITSIDFSPLDSIFQNTSVYRIDFWHDPMNTVDRSPF